MSSIRKTGFFKTKDNAKLYYEIHGNSGPIILMTYGLACPMNHWHLQVKHFSKNNRVILYDLRGHNKSSLGESPLSVDLLSQDALALLNHLFPKKTASFWGHSFGVPISLRAASISPKKVKSLVLLNGFYKNPFEKFLSTDNCLSFLNNFTTFYEAAPSLTTWIWKNLSDNSLFRIIAGLTGGFNLERAHYKDIEIYTKGVASLEVPTFIHHFKILFEFDGSKYFEKTKCPTLVIHGARDSIVPLEQNQNMATSLTLGEFSSFAEGSHCTQLDLPHQVNTRIEKFLKL